MANSSLWDTLSFRQSGTLSATTTRQFSHLTNDLVWSYTWDAENRLLSAETLPTVPTAARTKVSWVYDPAGRRIQRTVETNWNGTAYASTAARRYVYDGWQCVADLGWANDFLRQYAWGLDLSGSTTGAGGVGGLLWVRPSGSAAQFAAFDGNGNVTALNDGATGSVSAQYEYDTFGNTLRMTGVGTLAQDNGFRFSTKRADDLVGFILYEYRPYSPTLGRWLNRDPIGEKGGANLYGFVGNSPIIRQDPFGMESSDMFAGTYGPWPFPMPEPAVLLSIANKWTCSVDRTDDSTYFSTDPDALRAKSEVRAFISREIGKRSREVCAGKEVRIPTFVSGTETPEGAERLKALSKEIKEYPIPQGQIWARFIMGSIEWRVDKVAVSRCCGMVAWNAEVVIVDKLGWESGAYGESRFLEFIFGRSKEFERGRFHVEGALDCSK